jgi:glycosyltransferase involved in cell wall biosynthesis
MRVLIVSQYFWPESFRINELAKSLHQAGCTVTVLAGQPNYPDGVIFAGYDAATIRHDTLAPGFDVYRVPLVPRGRGSAIRLMLNYASFCLVASVVGPAILRGQEFDVIFVYGTSPILQVIPAIVLKVFKKVPLVTWVQDLWPESVEAAGFVSNRVVLALLERLVRWIYGRNDLLLAQSLAFVPILQELSGTVDVEYFQNPSEAAFTDAAVPAAPALVLPPGFNVVFAGNLGIVQALDSVLRAADLLRDEPDVTFVIVGSGSRLEWLRREVAQRGLRNVLLPGRFAPNDMPAILSQASALLVSLVDNSSMSQTVPSKVQTYLAVGRPIIAALNGEGARVVAEAGAGLCTPAEDASELAAAVRQLKALPADVRARMGAAGRRYHDEHFDPGTLARRLIERFRTLAESDGAKVPRERTHV